MPQPNNFRVDKKEQITSGPLVGRFNCSITFDCADCRRPSTWKVALWEDEIPYVTADSRAEWYCFRCDEEHRKAAGVSRPPMNLGLKL